MALLKQAVAVKVLGKRVMVTYHCEHEESTSFLLTLENARELSQLLELAADERLAPTAPEVRIG